ncbi:MazG nucleotide pyrophosphohydrolase domain-containing protein [Pyruvatibacter sp.]|uniref:MazG nucleotide pyrophosphohydrolase domain-containing protein n=1 Tax=Pyruvatibacter sp. TaxID=1981328 RepID=UPI0032EDFFC3
MAPIPYHAGMSEDAQSLTFERLQAIIRERYSDTDAARGTPGTFMWLIEEIGELATSLHECAPGKTPTPEQRHNLEEEFADVFAWLTTLANINDVDLTRALTKYTDYERVKGVKD